MEYPRSDTAEFLLDELGRPSLLFEEASQGRERVERDRITLPDRDLFMKEVNCTELHLHDAATTRAQRDSAGRRAVEQVLLGYRLMKQTGDVSLNYEAAGLTK